MTQSYTSLTRKCANMAETCKCSKTLNWVNEIGDQIPAGLLGCSNKFCRDGIQYISISQGNCHWITSQLHLSPTIQSKEKYCLMPTSYKKIIWCPSYLTGNYQQTYLANITSDSSGVDRRVKIGKLALFVSDMSKACQKEWKSVVHIKTTKFRSSSTSQRNLASQA